MDAREYNRRVKRVIAELKAAGAQRLAVDIGPDGTTRIVEASADTSDDEAARLGRLIEERMGNG